jgi:hypothetical protein
MAKEKPHAKPDDKEQSKLFIEKAREIGADEDRSASDELLGHLAKMKPEPRKKKKGIETRLVPSKRQSATQRP